MNLVTCFRNPNNNHPNMKYTVEVKTEIFLETKIVYSNDVITTEVKRNDIKLPVHWSLKVPKQYKRNAIISDLNRATRIANFPADEIPKIKQKFLNADNPLDLSIVSLISFKKNQMKLTTTSLPLVSLIFQRRLYRWIYNSVQKMKNFPNVS